MKLLKGGKSDPAGTPLLLEPDYRVSYENVTVTDRQLHKLKAALDTAPDMAKYARYRTWLYYANLKRWQGQGYHFHYESGADSTSCTCGLTLNTYGSADQDIAVVISEAVAKKLEAIDLQDLQTIRQHRKLPTLRGISVAIIVGFIWREESSSYLWTAICQQCGACEIEIFNVEAQDFVKIHNKVCGALIGEGGE